MNTMTTRSNATLAAIVALNAGGATAANASAGDSGHGTVKKPEVSEVEQLVRDAVDDGTVTLEAETVIKKASEDKSDLEFESLDDTASLS